MSQKKKRQNYKNKARNHLTTKFVPLCSDEEAKQPSLSDIGQRYFEPLLNAFSGYVLPHRAKGKARFTDDECKLYVNKRHWLVKVPESKCQEQNRYEQAMEALFWGVGPLAQDLGKQSLIFVSGTIGSGKSTFIDYYLRCYCPNRSERSVAFEEKLIIHFDLKNRGRPEAIDEKMWEDIKHSLDRADIDPTEIHDFDSEREPTQRLVRQVLQKISERLKSGSLGAKKYLILVIDNIDQSPVDCQTHCLILAQDVLQVTSNIKAWKIVFPMWPQTLGRLKRESRLTVKETEYYELELGHLDLSDFYRRKLEFIQNEYEPDNDPRATRMLSEVAHLASTAYKQILRDLTYGNFLTMDDLIVNMLRSKELEEHEARSSSHHISDYRFYDSLITGTCSYHNRDSSGIMNVFGWSATCDTEAHLFVVPYLINFLSDKGQHSNEAMLLFFQSAGFRRGLVEDAIDAMQRFHMLHFETDDVINPHRSVLLAYKRLMFQPAALDNFAITTPVRETSIGGIWKKTKGFEPGQFYSRCQTTICFLKELWDLEAKLETTIGQSELGLDKFRSQVPHISGRARNSYNRRLQHARDNRWPANAAMTDGRWEALGIEDDYTY